MLTEELKENLAEMLAEHITYETDFEEYVQFYCDMHDRKSPPRNMDSMDFESYFYDFYFGLYAYEREDEELIEKAIEEGVIKSLEAYLEECRAADEEFEAHLKERRMSDEEFGNCLLTS